MHPGMAVTRALFLGCNNNPIPFLKCLDVNHIGLRARLHLSILVNKVGGLGRHEV